jgi:hypothetical protein
MLRIVWVLMVMSLFLSLGCESPESSSPGSSTGAGVHCTEPENPYDEGTGHYAGYEWAEKNNPSTCGGSSQSFIEGCEEYQHQESEYADCQARKK